VARLQPGEWALAAQSSATYAAVGFDSPGVVDNGAWECENTTQVCEVHPKCGRIAAQMLQYPFAGHKKYASSWYDKATTYRQAATSGILSRTNRFYFDLDGYHGYCHSPGLAYCWSYTACLREMLNWLCSQPETSEQCCPNQEVRAACREDVNGQGCQVCWDAIQPGHAFDESAEFIREGGLDNATASFLRADAEVLELQQRQADQEAAKDKCEVCAFLGKKEEGSRQWAFISSEGSCGKHEEICAEVCGFGEAVDEIDDWDSCGQGALDKSCEGCD